MANETTTTSLSNAILSEALRLAVPAHTADKLVVRQLCAEDMLDDSESSLSRDYVVETDLGIASAGSEGTDVSANVELALGTTVTVTPTEGAATKATITTRALRKRVGGLGGLSGEGLYAALRHHISQNIPLHVVLLRRH